MNSLRELNGAARIEAIGQLVAALPAGFPDNSIYLDAASRWPVFAMQDNGNLLGGLILRPHGYATSEIFFMAVMPAAQSRGIGSALLAHAVAIARQQDRTNLVAWTVHSASAFWLKHGFAYLCDAHEPNEKLALYVKTL